jgi:hypothetical protein
MNFLREDSDLYRLCIEESGPLCREHVRVWQPHFAIKLTGSVQEFYSGLSANTRWQARSKEKKLCTEFAQDVQIRCFRYPAEVDEMVGDVEQVARTSYQRGLGVGFVDDQGVREDLRLKAKQGRLRGYILYLGGLPAAFWIGDVNHGTFGSDYLGYRAKLAKHSPGMYLTLKVIEGFCQNGEEGVQSVDFALGYAQYKEVLSNQKWRETCVHIFAPTMKGISLNLIRTPIVGLDQWLKTQLARAGFLQKIKKRWRGLATRKLVARS